MTVQFELWMLSGTIIELDSIDQRKDKAKGTYELVHNALLHSFLLAARNIHEFLFTENKKKDTDLIAQDFFDDPSQWSPSQEGPWKDQKVISVIHKSLAHMTWHRSRQIKPDWRALDIAVVITRTLGQFLDAAPRRRIDRRLKDSFVIHCRGLAKLCKKNKVRIDLPPTSFFSFVASRF